MTLALGELKPTSPGAFIDVPGSELPADLWLELVKGRLSDPDFAVYQGWLARLQQEVENRPQWYAVRTASRAEKRAALSIGDKLRNRDPHRDLAVYLPVETYWARHARKLEPKTRPLFVGYVLVCIRPEHMHVVRGCDGVEDFVRCGMHPRAIRRAEVNRLRDAEAAGDFDSTRAEDFGGAFKPDDSVKVTLGKWADWPGRVLKMTAPNRVKVLLSMFGKEHEKELDVGVLKSA